MAGNKCGARGDNATGEPGLLLARGLAQLRIALHSRLNGPPSSLGSTRKAERSEQSEIILR
jgi:hypothetical protein